MGKVFAAGLALLLAAPSGAPVQTARESGTRSDPAPDYSDVTSKAAARKRVRRGELVATLLFPAELGGPRDAANIIYIPPPVAEARELAIATIERQAERDLIDHLVVDCDYKGASIVPSRIRMRGMHSRLPGVLQVTLDVW